MEDAIILIEKRLFRIQKKYEFYRCLLGRRKVGSKSWNKTLNCVLNYGGKRKLLSEILEQFKRCLGGEIQITKITRRGKIVFIMQNTHDQKNSCKGKVKHQTLEAAWTCAKRFQKKRGDKMEAYKCRYCDFFHIGHSMFESDNDTKTKETACILLSSQNANGLKVNRDGEI